MSRVTIVIPDVAGHTDRRTNVNTTHKTAYPSIKKESHKKCHYQMFCGTTTHK